MTKQIIWEGKKLSASEALEIGLIDEVIGEDFQTAVKQKLVNGHKSRSKR